MRSLLGWSSCGLVPRPLQEVHPPPAADRGADRRRPRVCPPQKRKGPSRDKAPAAAARGANVAGSPATTGHPRVYPPSPTLPRTGWPRAAVGTEKGRRTSRWRGCPPPMTHAPPPSSRACSWSVATPTSVHRGTLFILWASPSYLDVRLRNKRSWHDAEQPRLATPHPYSHLGPGEASV